jgi:restriction system-associated AAA family ATPase
MKLLRVHIIKADTCGGLLDGFDIWLRSPYGKYNSFSPLCLIGPNGAGKSQFLQILAEIFQAAFAAAISQEERIDGNESILFEVEYLIKPYEDSEDIHVRIARTASGKRKSLVIQKSIDGEWVNCELTSKEANSLLPKKVVGYTSGDNETLSLPFFLSRGGYAREVAERALKDIDDEDEVPDTRLMLIDYGTHLEVFVANLLLGNKDQRSALLTSARLDDLHTFRCIIQLNHSAAPPTPSQRRQSSNRKGIQLINEFEKYLDQLIRCATCYDYDDKTETYILDFLVDEQTKKAFGKFWDNSLELYSAFHRLAMLNDLALPPSARKFFRKDAKRSFASHLPEPQEEDKVFRFERVTFKSEGKKDDVDYVSLSDGEHQLSQLLGTFCMLSSPGVLFLLDEPESHFNPQWRVEFISRLLDVDTSNGKRSDNTDAAQQDCIITTHSPFVPSDMSREQVFIFNKQQTGDRSIEVRRPNIETYGATFDAILGECFGVKPPISGLPRLEMSTLMKSKDTDKIEDALDKLGHSVEKVFLADHLRQLNNSKDNI